MRVYRFVAGIDPGKTGAVAVVEIGKSYEMTLIGIVDIPFDNEKGLIDLNTLFEHVRNMANVPLHEIFFVMESVHSRPTDGVASAFNFGKLYGSILGFMEALHLRYELISPQRWKRIISSFNPEADFKGKGKLASLEIARKYAGDLEPLFKYKKDHNRADAFLIALAGAREWILRM